MHIDDIPQAAAELEAVTDHLARRLGGGDPDAHQMDLYELAFVAAEAHSIEAVGRAAAGGTLPGALATIAAAGAARSAQDRLTAMGDRHGLAEHVDASRAVRRLAAAGDPATASEAMEQIGVLDGLGIPDDLALAAREFRRFAAEVIAPHADAIHRNDADIPDSIVNGLADIGAFGLSIPVRYGGSLEPGEPDRRPMVIATEELSRVSLSAGGSLVTRPEIMATALLAGGTDEQRERWLPAIASGRKLVAVAVTEPDTGSDVAAIGTRARPDGDRWILDGAKTWCTFGGRADLLLVLARTSPGPGHRGLSLFVVEKERTLGREFIAEQPGGGSISGRAIPTIGYRGMHSFEVTFDGWSVPGNALVGGEDGIGQGFRLQMEAFATGRVQTAARAVGLMRAAFDAALEHASNRRAFGHRLVEFGISRARLAGMAGKIAAGRLTCLAAAEQLDEEGGDLTAAMVKASTCRSAESVTRDAMQLHGGYGYAEEYPVSRYFVDARVLSIFEGAEEVLATKVIARRLMSRLG